MSHVKAGSLGIPGVSADQDVNRLPASGRVYRWEIALLQQLLRSLGDPPIRVILWNDQNVTPASESPVATVHFHDRAALVKTILNPSLHFGDMYSAGRIDVHGDLLKFLELIYRGSTAKQSLRHRVRSRWLGKLRNTTACSRKNIHHHYDIGNDFYQLWLDQNMLYTCAYFYDPSMTLEQAQIAKMDHICRKLQLKPGDRVVEAGCGWGGLARHMASRFGVTVRAFNISKEQIAYAREQACRQNITDRVEFIEDDYRNITGKYDAFVSVGMLEHVGVGHYRELGNVINRSLTRNGRGLIHSIGRHKPISMCQWIESRIFPGADPPTLREMMNIFEPYDLAVLDVENIRLHYARTLLHWLQRFDQHCPRVMQMFDEPFVRAWRLYLAGSAIAFHTGWMHLFQVVFSRYDDNSVPWTRAHLYS